MKLKNISIPVLIQQNIPLHPNAHFVRRNIVLHDQASVCRGGILS